MLHDSLGQLWRRIYYLIRGTTPVMRGHCNLCGRCCREIYLNAESGPIRSRWQFDRLCKKKPEFKRFVIVENKFMKKLVFRCSMLSEEGTCMDYDNRPLLCKRFPYSNIVYYGKAPSGKCGFYLAETTNFARILKKTIQENRKNKDDMES